MLEKVLTDLSLYIFAKDNNLKYLFCNENLAEAAGLDSPSQIIGKTDYDIFWKKHADFYRRGDAKAITGETRVNIPEIQTQPKGIANILVTKTQLMDNNENCVGVIGSYVDITGYLLTKKEGNFDLEKQRFYLGEPFCNEYLTRRELEVFRCILYGYTLKKIASLLKISLLTARWYVHNLKIKLQCHSKAEIMSVAIKHGLTCVLEEYKVWKNLTVD
ncbi:helix-turn-helix transcriptional regulator [Rickettsiella endosymbiont of Miltochrista miniata]|uniref:helix-turn-helix transcriptional regulator n=1 Tax=Rickettsiella endosymbiont of Miltochrista miniata TaxID=3066239 RepID=UPI00313EA5D8